MNRYHNSRGGKYSSSRGASSNITKSRTQPKGLFADGVWHCNCTPRLPAEHFKVKKEGKNQGRWFYTCQEKEPKRCDFFLWDEDAKPREEGAVLGNSRTEPQRRDVQEGWNAGRGLEIPKGKGLFTGKQQGETWTRDESTASASASPPPYSSQPQKPNAPKRKASNVDLDDSDNTSPWSLSGKEAADMENIARTGDAPETPHKAQKTGVYATPATTGNRKLPWLDQPATPATAKHATDYFASPSKPPMSAPFMESNSGPRTPSAPQNHDTPKSPSPVSRHKDALSNPADSGSSLTSEILAALGSARLPPDTLANVRSILSKHDLRTQGVTRGRDISRLALKTKDAKIAELQAKISSMEAEQEMERAMARMQRAGKGSGHA